ncbi:MAG: hypothetical protein M3Y87_03085 [Myxococcota bacterium]|nr:hypothetical protein [Myxococcota bacterium]
MTTDSLSERALLACRDDVITAAESKLRRPLSSEERNAIDRVVSLQMLESICMGFASEVSSAADVERELRSLCSRPAVGR